MKNPIPRLGLLLLSILLLRLSGCLLLVLLTFLCYLLFDLYGSVKADQRNGHSSS